MAYREKFFRAVEHKRTGLFGLTQRWTYVLIGSRNEEQRLNTIDLLHALVPGRDGPHQDAHMCISRAQELFQNGQSDWVGFPTGGVVADLNDM